jgi:hypothetical protein
MVRLSTAAAAAGKIFARGKQKRQATTGRHYPDKANLQYLCSFAGQRLLPDFANRQDTLPIDLPSPRSTAIVFGTVISGGSLTAEH